MAVVFISPRQRQKVFFTGITIAFLLFLLIVFFGVFTAKPESISSTLVLNKPKVSIDMSIFDSDQFKNLQPFAEMETMYSYKALNRKRKPEAGFLSAVSRESAEAILQGRGLVISELKEVEIGRDNPFVPYYEKIIVPNK